MGKWNGVGGKVDSGETITDAAIRECQEEIGVTPQAIQLAGYLQFFDPNDASFEHRCHVFTADAWEGEPIETEEMRPEWFKVTELPFDDMWPDDPLWMPHLLESKLFSGTISTSENEVVAHDIKIVSILEIQNA